jgi:hypothetical protein
MYREKKFGIKSRWDCNGGSLFCWVTFDAVMWWVQGPKKIRNDLNILITILDLAPCTSAVGSSACKISSFFFFAWLSCALSKGTTMIHFEFWWWRIYCAVSTRHAVKGADLTKRGNRSRFSFLDGLLRKNKNEKTQKNLPCRIQAFVRPYWNGNPTWELERGGRQSPYIFISRRNQPATRGRDWAWIGVGGKGRKDI